MNMTRMEAYRVAKMIGAGLIAAYMFISDHNQRILPAPVTIISQEWMLVLGAATAALVTMGAYLSTPPMGVKMPEDPALPAEDVAKLTGVSEPGKIVL